MPGPSPYCRANLFLAPPGKVFACCAVSAQPRCWYRDRRLSRYSSSPAPAPRRGGLEARDVEVVTGGVFLLVQVVLARNGVAVFKVADQHVLDAAAGGTLVPVVEIGDMDVVTFVVTPTGPHRTAVEGGQVRPLRIHLRHARRAVILALEFQLAVVLVVEGKPWHRR